MELSIPFVQMEDYSIPGSCFFYSHHLDKLDDFVAASNVFDDGCVAGHQFRQRGVRKHGVLVEHVAAEDTTP